MGTNNEILLNIVTKFEDAIYNALDSEAGKGILSDIKNQMLGLEGLEDLEKDEKDEEDEEGDYTIEDLVEKAKELINKTNQHLEKLKGDDSDDDEQGPSMESPDNAKLASTDSRPHKNLLVILTATPPIRMGGSDKKPSTSKFLIDQKNDDFNYEIFILDNDNKWYDNETEGDRTYFYNKVSLFDVTGRVRNPEGKASIEQTEGEDEKISTNSFLCKFVDPGVIEFYKASWDQQKLAQQERRRQSPYCDKDKMKEVEDNYYKKLYKDDEEKRQLSDTYKRYEQYDNIYIVILGHGKNENCHIDNEEGSKRFYIPEIIKLMKKKFGESVEKKGLKILFHVCFSHNGIGEAVGHYPQACPQSIKGYEHLVNQFPNSSFYTVDGAEFPRINRLAAGDMSSVKKGYLDNKRKIMVTNNKGGSPETKEIGNLTLREFYKDYFPIFKSL